MTDKQQIDEMAQAICKYYVANDYSCGRCPDCYARDEAKKLYRAGFRKQSEWISVEERLPEEGKDYLCRCIINRNTEYPFVMVLHYILFDENPHFQHECDDGLKVTHWMPLPEPLKGE